MKLRPPMWLPWLGPVAAAAAGALAGEVWLGGGFWTVLGAGLVCGFTPIIAYRIWKRLHHRR
ncbi:hypothetical protein [Brevundimonas sp.]|uniref:hypothetical protein n=1 Tax=Brevundimonas sp. TaxID=1871086 RepID=UPI002FDA5CCE